ncbi:30S ribosomal protein S18 [Balneola sp. MJW-20]|uniref:30S ribosomal protein S18 n=1 Tax=Gracilimonas aurantiaca TaxID=3234185 RepID=UPI003467347C
MIKNPSHPKKNQRKVKQCKFTRAGLEYIDYKDTETLVKFTNDQGKILPRRVTGTSARHQRMLTAAIKRARFLGLMPYVAENMR